MSNKPKVSDVIVTASTRDHNKAGRRQCKDFRHFGSTGWAVGHALGHFHTECDAGLAMCLCERITLEYITVTYMLAQTFGDTVRSAAVWPPEGEFLSQDTIL